MDMMKPEDQEYLLTFLSDVLCRINRNSVKVGKYQATGLWGRLQTRDENAVAELRALCDQTLIWGEDSWIERATQARAIMAHYLSHGVSHGATPVSVYAAEEAVGLRLRVMPWFETYQEHFDEAAATARREAKELELMEAWMKQNPRRSLAGFFDLFDLPPASGEALATSDGPDVELS